MFGDPSSGFDQLIFDAALFKWTARQGLRGSGSGKQAGAGPLSTLASGGGVFDNFRSSARRPELGDKPSPVPGVYT